jgi:hypothetical protein
MGHVVLFATAEENIFLKSNSISFRCLLFSFTVGPVLKLVWKLSFPYKYHEVV